jgi:hypothetical protein
VLRAQLRKASRFSRYHAGDDQNVRYTTFARQTGATPSGDVASASELRQRIAAAQERDECLSRLLPSNLPAFTTTHGYQLKGRVPSLDSLNFMSWRCIT